jgi:hypothetical protein
VSLNNALKYISYLELQGNTALILISNQEERKYTGFIGLMSGAVVGCSQHGRKISVPIK